MSLKVAYINIEFDRHLDTVIPFLQKENPDVVLLNEVLEPDIPRLMEALSMKAYFAPQCIFTVPRGSYPWGQAIFSKLPMTNDAIPYAGVLDIVQVSDDPLLMVPAQRYQLILAHLQKGEEKFTLGLTHFPWTPDGEASDYQRDALPKLLSAVKKTGEIVLFGDFNAPRGKEIFGKLAAELADNIPVSYTSSLDGTLHRLGEKKFKSEKMDTYMVDGCFTTPAYRAENVRLTFGVSDHAAVTADISRA
jgi:endonuclease/exonuclease/phosphatase family metal-dependent hydrolase